MGSSDLGVRSDERCVILDCRFVIPQSSVGVKFNYPGSTNCNVRNSTFEGGSVGVSFTSRASGSIIDCVFHEQWNKAIVLDCQMATVVGNTIKSTEGTASGMSLSNEGLVMAYDNVIRSGGQGIFVHTGSPLDFHDNHILRQGDGWLVRTPSIWPWPETHADLRNNWWGTDDRRRSRSGSGMETTSQMRRCSSTSSRSWAVRLRRNRRPGEP